MMPFPEFEELKPMFITPCGCKGYYEAPVEGQSWSLDIVPCSACYELHRLRELPELPEGTVLIDVHAHHLQHMSDITNS